MKRSFSIAQTSIAKLLDNRVPATNMKPVLASYLRLVKTIDKGILDDIPDTLSNVETIVQTIKGMDPFTYIDEHEKTVPEDLSGDEVGLIFAESERSGALTIHGSFTRLFCKYALSPMLNKEIQDFILLLFKSKHFIEQLKTIGEQIKSEEIDMDSFVEMGEDIDFNKRMYLFIVSNELDSGRYFNKDFIKMSLQNHNRIISNPSLFNWAELYIKILDQILEDDSKDELEDVLKLLD